MTQVQQQRPESPTVTLTWHACQYKVHKLHERYVRPQKRMPPSGIYNLKKTLFDDVITKGRLHNIVIIVARFLSTVQYNNSLLFLKKEIQLSAFDK